MLLAWPVTSLVINYIRHLPRYTQPGVGTQHILFVGLLLQIALFGTGLGLLIARNW